MEEVPEARKNIERWVQGVLRESSPTQQVSVPTSEDGDSSATMNNMADPASGVPAPLLPHLHLVSKNRFPSLTSLSLETVVEFLLQAPKIVRDLQPMHWMMLDGPPDGSLMLVWQPLNHLGTNFATDGYLWADAEQAYNTTSRGYGVEMWIHKSGYHPPEQVATHCRKRYRLTLPRDAIPNSNLPPPDPALWIVHYSKADPRDQVRASSVQIPPVLQHQLGQRRWIQQQGQVVRKEFMLHDRISWPTINFPNVPMPPAFTQNPYQQNAAMSFPRQGYPPQAPGPVPAGSRRSQPGGGHGRMPSLQGMPAHDSIDDEEDISRGDLFDFLTPRDISKHRYRQATEWMEEIWSTPFSVGQIVPVSLGLGRKGELYSLTKGFFDMPTGVSDKDQDPSNNATARVGRMESGKADEFMEQANQKLTMMRGQISKMKEVHTQRMANLDSTKFWKDAERRTRDAVFNPDPSNPDQESWRIKSSELSEEAQVKLNGKDTVGDVIAEVEAKLGQRIVKHHEFDLIQKGGLLESKADRHVAVGKESTDDGFDMSMNFNNGNMMDTDVDMGNTAGSLLDQFKTSNTTTPAPLLATPTPNSQDYTHHSQSASNTPAPPSMEQTGPSPLGLDGAADEPNEPEEAVPQVSDMDMDIEMAGIMDEPVDVEAPTEQPAEAVASGAEEGGDGSPGEWVMVSNDERPGSQEPEPAIETPVDHPTTDIQHSENADITPGVFGDTPGGGLHGLTPAEHSFTPVEHVVDHVSTDTPNLDHGHGHDDNSFPHDTDFGNIDTIGDELEGYTEQNQELDLADLDNSAFGDAFHASDAEGMDGGEGHGVGNEHEHEHGHDIA